MNHMSNNMGQSVPISGGTARADRIPPSEGLSRLLTELSRVNGQLEPGQVCALNQDRETFLGLRVVAGDLPMASFIDWITTLTPNSGAGIWLNPFRGIPADEVRSPMDLVYLDQDCRVISVVEFFPTYRVSPSAAPAASVLAVPTHSIFSSHTQPGDQLVLCPAAEMEWQLERMAQTGSMGGVYPAGGAHALRPVLVRDELKTPARPAPVREMPARIADPVPVPATPVVREESKAAAVLPEVQSGLDLQPEPQPVPPSTQALPAAKSPKDEKPWMDASRTPAKKPLGKLGSWLFPDPPDPRKMLRQPVEGLVAHFFTGGAPQAHEIRDVSPTGFYLVTAERWYPGTLIRMTLSKPDIGQSPADRSITIQARAVRWGNDGVGLEFVVEPGRSRRGPASPLENVDAGQLAEYLKRVVAPKQ
jgi:hypothetical protein